MAGTGDRQQVPAAVPDGRWLMPDVPTQANMPAGLQSAQRRTAMEVPADDRLQLLRWMLADVHWSCPPGIRGQLLQVLASAAGHGCADERAWLAVAEQITRYLLYRRGGQQRTDPLGWTGSPTGQGPALDTRMEAGAARATVPPPPVKPCSTPLPLPC